MWLKGVPAFLMVTIFGILAGYILIRCGRMPTSGTAVTEFYSDVRQQDGRALDGLFVPAISSEDLSVRSRLFRGKDLDGTPGGPTFGQTNSASYRLVSYSVQGNDGLTYRVVEQREYQSVPHEVHVNVELVNVKNTWKVKAYRYPGNDGAYSAFLLE